jgi:oligoendopeptidase F
MSTPETADPELASVEWDLSDLLNGHGEEPAAAVDGLLDDAQRRADAFRETYQGRVAQLEADELAAAMRELGELQELVGRAGSFAGLRFATSTSRSAARRSRPRSCSSSSSGRRSRTTARRRC